MKKNYCYYLLTCCLFVFAANDLQAQAAAIPVRKDGITILYGTKAFRLNGAATKQNGDFIKIKDTANLTWKIKVQSAGRYEINFVYGAAGENGVQLVTNHVTVTYHLRPTMGAFGAGSYERVPQEQVIDLGEGEQMIRLQTGTVPDKKSVDLRSIEVVPLAAIPAMREDSMAAVKARASSEWLNQAGYGVMFHWTSLNVGKDGSHKPFEQAVHDFDLPSFVKMVQSTGSGYVIFTIGHAEAYCPAPLVYWEKYHPGHTTKRDLIAEWPMHWRQKT